MKKRILLKTIAMGAALAFGAGSVLAQNNAKPVRIIVAFAAGGPVDAMARTLAEPLGRALGKTVIVEKDCSLSCL